MKQKAFFISLILIAAFFTNCLYAQDTTYLRSEIPLRFNFKPTGSLNLDKESPPIPAGLFTAIKAYILSGDVPWEISIPGKLTIECPKNQIYPGNQAICRAWIESEDDPNIYELSSNFGLSMGVKLVATDWFGHEYEIGDFGKDFVFPIRSHKKMPLGNDFLCGMNTVEYVSFPLDEFIPESTQAGKVTKTLLSANDIAGGYDILSFGIAGEIVIEGLAVLLNIDGQEVRLTGFRNPTQYPDPSDDPNVKTFPFAIPQSVEHDPRFSWDSRSMVFNPIIQYNFRAYYQAGLQFTLIPGISFNILPEVVTRGRNPMTYTCPGKSTLDEWYFVVGDSPQGLLVSNNIPISIALPLTDTPDLPDVAITEIFVNGVPEGQKAYIGEKTRIEFNVTNLGNKKTSDDPYWSPFRNPHFAFSVYVDGKVASDPYGEPILFRGVAESTSWYVNVPPVVLDVNETVTIGGIYYTFENPGYHEIKITIGHAEYKGVADGQPVYGIGDLNVRNNTLIYGINVLPQRGTVIGKVMKNPCQGDCGVNGIQVCLRNRSGGDYNECVISAKDESYGEGVYRFANVPTGDYQLEFLPPIPTQQELEQGADYFVPLRFNFHHNEGDVDNFTTWSGMWLKQYQTFKGKVVNESGSPLSGVEVILGEFGAMKTETDSKGEFSFKYLIPMRDYKLYFRHPQYKTKEVVYHLSVSDSFTKETNISSGSAPYWDSDFNENRYGVIKMQPDNTPPSLEIIPLENKGYMGSSLNFSFRSYDNDKNTYQYRYRILDSSGNTRYQSNWLDYRTSGPAEYLAASQELADLTDGPYALKVEVTDWKGNITQSDLIPFIKDTVPPALSVRLEDPVTGEQAWTNNKKVDVLVNITNSESGELALYLSNDGQKWTFIKNFTGSTVNVKNWNIVDEDTFSGTEEVYVKIIDLAGNEGVGSDTINVDTTGAIILGGGSCCWGSKNSVPLKIDITPPDGEWQFREIGAGEAITIGNSEDSQYFAQKIVLNEAKPINLIKFFMAEGQAVYGTPSPLHIKLVRSLCDSDPASNSQSNVIKEWTFTYGDVYLQSIKYISYIPLDINPAITLNPGTYYLLIYTESVDSNAYYKKPTGYYSLYQENPENHMRYAYKPSEARWVEEKEYMEIWTLSYEAYNSPQGQIKISSSGKCDDPSLQWMDYHKGYETYIDLPNEGLNTVCVRYYNPSYDKYRDYFASIFIDTSGPEANVTYTVDRSTKTYYFNFDVKDNLIDVEYIKYRVAGVQNYIPFARTIALDPSGPFNNIFRLLSSTKTISFSLIDKVGNESQVYDVTISNNDDILPPEITMTINGGNAYTNSTNVTVEVSARDSFELSKIHIKELKTGKTWAIPNQSTLSQSTYSGTISISLPSVTIDGEEFILDGTYSFIAYAEDAQGNVSGYANARITLDRTPPEVTSILLTSTDGKAYTVTEDLILNIEVSKDLSPLSLRYRFKPDGQWSFYENIYPGLRILSIKGPTPIPQYYTIEVEIRDAAGNITTKDATIRTNRRPNRPDSITLSTTYSLTPTISIDYSDPDGDPFSWASFVIQRQDHSTVFATGPIEARFFEVPPGFLSYNTTYTVTGYVVDSYGLFSFYRDTSFILKKPTLTMNKDGNKDGKVLASPGIDCGNTCEAQYEYKQTITLTATPDEGAAFSGWADDCASCETSPSCSILMDKDKTCKATFIDATYPLLNISTLPDGSYTNKNTLNISGKVTDDTGIKNLTINNMAISINQDGSFSYALVLTKGSNTIVIIAEDQSGNKTTDTRTIHYDPDAPTLTITYPPDNTVTNQSTIEISGTVDEQSTISISLNNNPAQSLIPSNNAFSLTIALVEGLNTIDVVAADVAGNTSSIKRTIIFDSTKPSLSITYPSEDMETASSSLVLKGNVTDITDVLLTITIDGKTYYPQVVSGLFEQSLSFLEPKTYQITVSATDRAGNTSYVTRNIIYTKKEDTITLSSGWNFISFPKLTQDTSISTVMEGKNVRIIWGYDNVEKNWHSSKPGALNNTLTTFESGKGYWIYMNSPSTIDMTGWQEAPNIIILQPGWNLVGWLGVDGKSVDQALSSLGDNWLIIWGWEEGIWKARCKDPSINLNLQPLDNLTKGKAYWIKMESGATWEE
jgi:uncharacterized protein YfaP (DUF2135 family)